jgi:membrane protein implicated in regulation of membrane protease activity
MSITLTDFLGQHLVLLWLTLAVMLGALVLLRNDRTMARMAVCALCAGVVALIFAHLWWLQLTVFVASVVGLVIGTAVRRRRHVPVGDTPTDSV